MKSGQTVIQTPEDFTKVAGKFVLSITTKYLPKEAEITEPEDIDNPPLIQDMLQIHRLERYIMKETKSQSNFLKRLQMRNHSIVNGTAGLVR